MSQNIAVVGNGDVDFRFLEVRFAGEAGAREAFERLVADIVGIVHPDVREIQANPGDWGIDAYVGDLGQDGEVHIWQSKFYMNGFGATQQDDVRESYSSAIEASKANGYKIKSWTLCIPCELDAPMLKWWTGWKRRKEKELGIVIQLETAGNLRRRLQAPAGQSVREMYFSPLFNVPQEDDGEAPTRGLQMLPEEAEYDDALFVHQLNEAGISETNSAREAFFNAEILEREIADKGIGRELTGLATWRVRVASTWSNAFISACETPGQRLLPGLYSNVVRSIENEHATEANALRAHVLHGVGLLHQSVDNGKAGWVRDWRRVAADFLDGALSNISESEGEQDG
ncbi:hypothetical protein [Leucobacter chromiireducens]|uniref:hypothetical protein n=1 Tax=Leucobacter chromiireducens TaxID=283877 RepID=UPI000F632600|nr:hypothetical protein [Leucobacter chromiireducens]